MPTDTKRIVWVDLARVLGAFAVVMLHFPVSGNLLVDAVSHGLFRFAVPLFVMLSGYSLAPLPADRGRRIWRVIVPLAVWSLVYGSVFAVGMWRSDPWAGLRWLLWQLLGVQTNHLWYLYMTVGLYLFLPWFKQLALLPLRLVLPPLLLVWGLSAFIGVAQACRGGCLGDNSAIPDASWWLSGFMVVRFGPVLFLLGMLLRCSMDVGWRLSRGPLCGVALAGLGAAALSCGLIYWDVSRGMSLAACMWDRAESPWVLISAAALVLCLAHMERGLSGFAGRFPFAWRWVMAASRVSLGIYCIHWLGCRWIARLSPVLLGPAASTSAHVAYLAGGVTVIFLLSFLLAKGLELHAWTRKWVA